MGILLRLCTSPTIVGLIFFILTIPYYVESSKVTCGTIYSELNNTGHYFPLVDGRIISDLKYYLLSTTNKPGTRRKIGYEEFEKTNITETWYNQIKSVKVKEDCSLLVCDDTYVKGDCKKYEGSVNELYGEAEGRENISSISSSVGCVCRQPNCEETTCSVLPNLRNIECGRFFFEPNCTVCSSAYYTIQKKNVSNVDDKISESFKSIYVKSGCSFTGYAEEDFEGDEITIDSSFQEEWGFNIRSHSCVCGSNPNTNVSSITQDEEFSDIEMLDIPNNESEIVSLLQKYPQHPGLLAALASATNGRSPNKVYILVLGLTGSGKSATINFLFDSDVARVGGEESVTNAIHEYRIPVQSPELGCGNCELRIIDTPGFGDTKGLESDAKFLAGLEQYFNTHEDLKNHLPNVVLVMAKFSDNRIKGKNSAFVKALRGIELFRDKLFDLKYSNGITVLTHFMSENNRKVLRNPSSKLDLFRNLIEEYTLFPKPLRVVVAENKPELGLTPLPMLNGYYLLPNAEFYPKNLFDQIQEATKYRDPMGESIIRTAFKDPENFKIVEHIYHLYNQSFNRESHFLSILSSLNYDIERTEISVLLNNAYNNGSIISDEMKKIYPGALEYTQRILNLQKIITRANLPSTRLELVKFFRNIRLNPLIQELISKALQIEVPNFGNSFLVGQGYNLLEGKILEGTLSSPLASTELKPSEIGYKIPTESKCTVLNENIDIYNTYSTFLEYVQTQVVKLTGGGNRGIIKSELLEGNKISTRPSYNVKQEYLGNSSTTTTSKGRKISVIREYRYFKLELYEKLKKLDNNFTTLVKNLPNFNTNVLSNVEQWTTFFHTYGTHVVSRAYGGGFIEIIIDCSGTTTPNSTAAIPHSPISYEACQNYVNSAFEFIDELTGVGAGQGQLLVKQNNTNNTSFSPKLTWKMYGGDSKYHLSQVMFNRGTPAEIRHIIDSWIDSLWTQPIMLESSFEVIPITEIIKQFSLEGSKKVSVAVGKLFSSALAYVPPPTKRTTTPPPPREEIVKSTKMLLQLCGRRMRDTEFGSEEHYGVITVYSKKGKFQYYRTHKMDVTGSDWLCWGNIFWIDFSDTTGIYVDINESDDGFYLGDDDIDSAYFNIAQLSIVPEVISGNIKIVKLV